MTLSVLVLYVGLGSTFIAPGQVFHELLSGPRGGSGANDIIWQIRLPRAVGTLCVGGLLSCVGCAFQGLLRNPLADPFVVGVSSGSAFGAVAAMLTGFAVALGGAGLPLAGFVGGMLALGIVFGLSTGRSGLDVRTLLLAGVVTGSMLSALLSLFLYWAGQDANQILHILLGDTSGLLWWQVGTLGLVLMVGFAVLFAQTRALNAFAIGEQTALRLGVNTRRLKPIVLCVGAAMTATAVAFTGIIGFVGLVAPHVARSLVGTDWRRSMPVSAVLGGLLLLASDLLAQRLLSPEQLPLGVVTAILGAPVLLVLLRREP